MSAAKDISRLGSRTQRRRVRRKGARARYLVRALTRRGYAFSPGRLATAEGVAGGAAVALLVFLAMLSKHPELAWAAFAGFWTCLADPRDAGGRRLRAFAAFGISGALVSGGVSALASPGSTLTGVALSALVGLCIFASVKRAGMSGLGGLVSVVAVVAAEEPARRDAAVAVALTFLGGAALISILFLTVLPRARPEARPPSPGAARPTRGAAGHSLACAVVVLVTYTVVHALHLPSPQWATMGAVVVTHPDIRTSRTRAVERVLGSIIGGCAGGAITAVVAEPVTLTALVFPLAAATIALRSVNYTLFVCFLTPLFVVVAEIMAPDLGWAAAGARVADNVLGSMIALSGYAVSWLWNAANGAAPS